MAGPICSRDRNRLAHPVHGNLRLFDWERWYAGWMAEATWFPIHRAPRPTAPLGTDNLNGAVSLSLFSGSLSLGASSAAVTIPEVQASAMRPLTLRALRPGSSVEVLDVRYPERLLPSLLAFRDAVLSGTVTDPDMPSLALASSSASLALTSPASWSPGEWSDVE